MSIRKRWAAFLTAFALIAAALLSGFIARTAPQPASAAETPASVEVSLTFHYHRFEADYDGWNVWLWVKGKDGKAYTFSVDDNFGKAFTVNLTCEPGADAIGFIVRKGEWVDKDIAADRFIAYNSNENGSVEVWIVEGEPVVAYREEDTDISARFRSAAFSNMTTIEATVTEALTADNTADVAVTADGAPVETRQVKYSGKKLTVTLKDAMSFTKAYAVSCAAFGTRPVSLTNLYDTQEFESAYTYDGALGALYSKTQTEFKLWAPTATKVTLNTYTEGSGENREAALEMTRGEKGVWSYTLSGDNAGMYYTYSVTAEGMTNEVVDPYARAAGVNGKRGMVIDLAATDPEGWSAQETIKREKTDSVIYEAHIRDLTIDPSSGVSAANRGKFLGLTETGTKNSAGLSTALDHMKELGVTELHILPMFDYGSVDESKLDTAQFNWGYDPLNYNVPEGSYSTDPTRGEVRVSELKQMILALHNNGIRVVMDVVYNHTHKSADSNFNLIVPGYYYRTVNGAFSNGSGCGNETASERAMYRKFMVDSVKYWASEYKIDGFRFDLMGLHDIETMNLIADELYKINDSVLLYGEGWTAGDTPLPETDRALKKYASEMPRISVFSDDMRDGLKGSVFDAAEPGFVSGAAGRDESVKFGAVGAVSHPQVSHTARGWAASPSQSINYVSAHDNLTLWDKLNSSTPGATESQRVDMNLLAAASVLTSQGIPFFQAGEELLRTKPKIGGGFDENSYSSPDSTNSIKWDTKTDNKEVFEYYRGLIAVRKALPQLRMTSKEDVINSIYFMETEPGVVSYTIEYGAEAKVTIVLNANPDEAKLALPAGSYKVLVKGRKASAEGVETFNGGTLSVSGISAWVAVSDGAAAGGDPSNLGLILGITIPVAVIAVAGAVTAFVLLRKKRRAAADSGDQNNKEE